MDNQTSNKKKKQGAKRKASLLVGFTVLGSIISAIALSAGTLAGLYFLHHVPGVEVDGSLDLKVAAFLDSMEETTNAFQFDYNLKDTGLTLFNPEGWHGPDWFSQAVKGGFFEGYYFKFVTESGRTLAIIPGAIYQEGGGGYAFVMLANPGSSNPNSTVILTKYTLDEFTWDRSGRDWSISVGPNKFSAKALHLEGANMNGDAVFETSTHYPSSLLQPDVMGWFAYIPGLECRHGVVSLSSQTSGSFTIDGDTLSLTNGLTYIEKDWGSKFPKTWVWLQSSHFTCDEQQEFKCKDAAVMLSVASIPLPSDALELFRFRGFLGFLTFNGEIFRFGTYTGAAIESLDVSVHGRLSLIIRTAQHRLTLSGVATSADAAILYGPAPGGAFEPFVREMLDAEFDVTLTRRSDNTVVFQGKGTKGGLEMESLENEMHLIAQS